MRRQIILGWIRGGRSADATAAVNEELHLSTLRNLALGWVYVQSSRQLAEAL